MATPSFFGLSPQETALALEQERMQQLPQNKPYFAGDINFAVANQNLRELGPRVRAAVQERSFKPLFEGGLGGFRDPRMQRAMMLDEARQEVASSGIDLNANPIDYYNSAFTALMKRGLVDEANMVRTQAMSELQQLKPTANQQALPYEIRDGVKINKVTGETTLIPGATPNKKTNVTYFKMPGGNFESAVQGSEEEGAILARGGIPSSAISSNKPEKPVEDTFGKEVAKTSVEAIGKLRDNALNAPRFAEAANNIDAMLASGAITGPGAQLKLAFARTMGFMGAETEAIAASEQLFKSLAETTLAAIPSAGLGTGQGFTDKDLKFLQAAVSGEIAFTPATLKKVAEYNRKLADTSVKAFNSYYSNLPESRRAQLSEFGITPMNLPEVPATVTSDDISKVPSGVDPELWNYLSPEEKSQFIQSGK